MVSWLVGGSRAELEEAGRRTGDLPDNCDGDGDGAAADDDGEKKRARTDEDSEPDDRLAVVAVKATGLLDPLEFCE